MKVYKKTRLVKIVIIDVKIIDNINTVDNAENLNLDIMNTMNFVFKSLVIVHNIYFMNRMASIIPT